MSQYILSAATLEQISRMLQLNSISDHFVESASGQRISLTLTVDRNPKDIHVNVSMSGEHHTLIIPNDEPRPTYAVGNLIQAIANGTLDTAINALPLTAKTA